MRLLIALMLSALALAQAPPQPLTLERALQTAAENRAEGFAAEHFVEAQQGAVRQASRAPNPTLSFQTENWRAADEFSVSRDVDYFVFVSQQIETSGKRRLRTDAAEADTRIARAEREVLRWQIQNQVTVAWWNAFRAQQETALIQESLGTAEELVRYQEVRLREGAGPEIDLIKVRVELEKERRRLAESRIAELNAKHRLLAEMASDMPADFPLQPGGEPTASEAEISVASALANRPDLLLARRIAERDEALTSVQRAQTSPDITPYFGYKRTGGFSTLIGGVSIPLKIRDRNDGAIAHAVAQASRHKQLLRAAEMRVRSDVESALAAQRSRRQIAQSLQTGLVADATQSPEIALAAYREGGVELLYVIDALRTLNEARLLQLQAELDYQLSRAETLIAAGVSPNRMTQNDEPIGGVK
ncbi:MAG: TolC family protein [Acidobacteria bacterium]|nr:TolC family protein [Acidobacteriota bacterium]MDA1237030.1 TolC family protein [Acidobacteriota bacterium]